MDQTVQLVSAFLLPAILAIFVGLYVLGMVSGLEPEAALLRSGMAAVLLAVLGRIASAVLESAPPVAPGSQLDVSIGDDETRSGPADRR